MKSKTREEVFAYVFLLPSLLGTAIFILLPFAETLRRSFTNPDGKRAVGLENYSSVLENAAFRTAALNTAKFICICVPIILIFALIMAILLHNARSKAKNQRTIMLLPMILPAAGISMVWQLLFAHTGLVNGALAAAGLAPISFMDTGAAFWLLVGTYVWKNGGFDMILFLAGLDGVSPALYEAAEVDGAGKWSCFLHITLPQLSGTLALAGILSVINTFKVYREAYLVAGNYPHNSIYMLGHLFNNWFMALDLGRISAAAVMMCIVLCALILPLRKVWIGDGKDFYKTARKAKIKKT